MPAAAMVRRPGQDGKCHKQHREERKACPCIRTINYGCLEDTDRPGGLGLESTGRGVDEHEEVGQWADELDRFGKERVHVGAHVDRVVVEVAHALDFTRVRPGVPLVDQLERFGLERVALVRQGGTTAGCTRILPTHLGTLHGTAAGKVHRAAQTG